MAKRPKAALTAKTADKHVLYEASVQCPEAEIDFVDKTFRRLRGRYAVSLREDFCGTAATACEWVRRRPSNTSVGVDLHGPTLAWGKKHHVASLSEEAKQRLTLLKADVRSPGSPAASGTDIVLAMNFSYWIFKTRQDLIGYFRSVHASLGKEGVFFLDHFGGWEAQRPQQERRKQKGFTYVWDQAEIDMISGQGTCKIHFEFKDGTRMKNAFTYSWRLWSLIEIREALVEAGFGPVTVYWEGDDGKGGGNGIFKPTKKGEACPCYVAYISAEK